MNGFGTPGHFAKRLQAKALGRIFAVWYTILLSMRDDVRESFLTPKESYTSAKCSIGQESVLGSQFLAYDFFLRAESPFSRRNNPSRVITPPTRYSRAICKLLQRKDRPNRSHAEFLLG